MYTICNVSSFSCLDLVVVYNKVKLISWSERWTMRWNRTSSDTQRQNQPTNQPINQPTTEFRGPNGQPVPNLDDTSQNHPVKGPVRQSICWKRGKENQTRIAVYAICSTDFIFKNAKAKSYYEAVGYAVKHHLSTVSSYVITQIYHTTVKETIRCAIRRQGRKILRGKVEVTSKLKTYAVTF